jgi:hypothetical protein
VRENHSISQSSHYYRYWWIDNDWCRIRSCSTFFDVDCSCLIVKKTKESICLRTMITNQSWEELSRLYSTLQAWSIVSSSTITNGVSHVCKRQSSILLLSVRINAVARCHSCYWYKPNSMFTHNHSASYGHRRCQNTFYPNMEFSEHL